MRVKRSYVTAASLASFVLVGVACALIPQQAAQDAGATANQPRTVLIEKGRVVSASPLPTQPEPARAPGPLEELDAGLPRSFASAVLNFERTPVKGAPFSAELVIETARPLPDGTSTTRKLTSVIYRDNDGRTRSDRMAEQTGSRPAAGDKPRLSVINDPVAGVTHLLEHRAGVARQTPLTPPRRSDSEEAAQAGEAAAPGGRSAPAFATLKPRVAPGSRGSLRGEETAAPAPDTKRESLGRREIEGVMAEGTRLTRTIPAGAFGNNQPVEIVAERWYSPDLQTVVLIKRNDPRFGESVYRLTGIRRGEPAHALFEVPSGYTIK
jgi:hypothetical protein